MRILHLMGTFHLGGSEEFVIDLAIWLRAAGHNVHVATVWTNPLGGEYANAQRQRLVRAGVPFSELGLSSFRRSIPLLPYRVTRVIDAFEPDLVQSHTDLPDFTVALTRPLRRIALARTIFFGQLIPTWAISSNEVSMTNFFSPSPPTQWRPMTGFVPGINWLLPAIGRSWLRVSSSPLTASSRFGAPAGTLTENVG